MEWLPQKRRFLLLFLFYLTLIPHSLQSRTKYLTKVEKSSKIGHERKSLISAFTCFLTVTAKV